MQGKNYLYKAGIVALLFAVLGSVSFGTNVFAKEAGNENIISENTVDVKEELEEEATTITWADLDMDNLDTAYTKYKSQFDNAPLLQIGQTIVGHTYQKGQVELYKIEIPGSGKVLLDCGENNYYSGSIIFFDSYYNKWDAGYFELYDKEMPLYFSEKGTYYIALNVHNDYIYGGTYVPTNTYQLKVSFISIDTDEKECNDTFDRANTIELNRSFVGINDDRWHLASRQYSEQTVGDYDYVKFYFPGGNLYIYEFSIYNGSLATPQGSEMLFSNIVHLLNQNKELVAYDGRTYSTGGTGEAGYLGHLNDNYEYISLSEGGSERVRNIASRQTYKNLPAGIYYIEQNYSGQAYEIFASDNSDWDFWLAKSKFALRCLRNSEDSEYWKNYTPSYVDAEQVSAFVNRLYDLCFGRKADETGFADWNNALMSRSKTAAEVAQGFFFSDEMKNRNLTNEEYVELLYQVMMNRNFDEGGKQYWMNSLANGVSREFVYRGFAESQEFSNLCNSYGIERGTVALGQYRDRNMQATGFIARLYTKMLGRSFDEDGLEYWCRLYLRGERTIENIAGDGFLHSQELKNQNLSNEEFVRRMYQTFLNREPEEAGLKDWVGRLERGEETRDSLVYGFTNSAEFGKLKAEYNLP